MEMEPREKANVASTSAKKKKMPGRKGVATSSTDLESHPVIKIPPSDKNSKLDLAQPPTPSYPELHLALEI